MTYLYTHSHINNKQRKKTMWLYDLFSFNFYYDTTLFYIILIINYRIITIPLIFSTQL